MRGNHCLSSGLVKKFISGLIMNKRFCKLMFSCLAFGSCYAYAIESTPLIEKNALLTNAINDIDSIVNDVLDTFNVPGIAIGIVVDGKVVLNKGYGYRNLEQSLPTTENTLFGI